MAGTGGPMWWRRGMGGVVLVALSTGGLQGCTAPPPSGRMAEARALASALHHAFTESIEAANRAVMAGSDTAATAAANEAREAMAAVERHDKALREVLQSLGYHTELKRLDGFAPRFAEYRRLTDDMLVLVLENTNVKAQRLAFGPATDAAEAFHAALESAAKAAPGAAGCCAGEQATRAWAAVLEIRALHARHIAEADEAEMSRMEAAMSASAGTARAAVDALARTQPGSAAIASARSALDRFMTVQEEIIDLSRRNSNVRALAMSLGRNRTIAAECEAGLQAVEDALAGRESGPTR